jgi:hypothetical protein
MSLKDWHELSGFLVDSTLLTAAIMAVIRFRLFNVLGHRWRSDLVCAHWNLDDGQVIFSAEYTLQNTGQRPLSIRAVSLKLVGAKSEGALLLPDVDRVLAHRVLRPDDPALRGLFHVESGERSIYTLRCRLPALDDVVFVLCGFDLKHKRVPAAYRGFYCRAAQARTTGAASATSGVVTADTAADVAAAALRDWIGG